jgi:hypothetical protein
VSRPECRSGGVCDVCNSTTHYCAECGDVEVSDEGETCIECHDTLTDPPFDTREEARCER